MTVVNTNPCYKGRAANALGCAREYARNFVRQHRRMPSRDDIRAHIPSWETYSEQHKSNILSAAWSAADSEMKKVFPCPAALQQEILLFTEIFCMMGYTISPSFNSNTGSWRVIAATMPEVVENSICDSLPETWYIAANVQSLFAKMAEAARAAANDTVAA